MKAPTLLMLSLAAGLGGCGAGSESQLRARAAFDLNCPEEQLTVSHLGGGGFQGGGTKGVEGCGRRTTYVYVPEGNNWVMNTDAQPSQKGSSAPTQ